MGKEIPIPFNVTRWLTSHQIRSLPNEYQAAFLNLLCHCWASGDAALTADEDQLMFLSGLKEKWQNTIGRKVRAMFIDHPTIVGSLTNQHLYDTWQTVKPKERPKKSVTPKEPFKPPTVEEVRAYVVEKKFTTVDSETFVDFYTSKGWVVGKLPMKDWKAAVRTWTRNRNDVANGHNRMLFDRKPVIPPMPERSHN